MKHSFIRRFPNCVVCGSHGNELATECPGRKLTDREKEFISSNTLDFRDGTWIFLGRLPVGFGFNFSTKDE